MDKNKSIRLSKTNQYKAYASFARTACSNCTFCNCGTGGGSASRKLSGTGIPRVVLLDANIKVCPGYIN